MVLSWDGTPLEVAPIEVVSDASWGDLQIAGKSTSGCVIKMAGFLLASFSKT